MLIRIYRDIQDYNSQYEHTANVYQELSDYFRFMVCDGNIQSGTYELMQKQLDELFEQYKKIHNEIVDEILKDEDTRNKIKQNPYNYANKELSKTKVESSEIVKKIMDEIAKCSEQSALKK